MKNLLVLLKSKGLKQYQMANDLGIENSLFNKYVQEKVDPSVSTALKIAEYLDVSIDYLVGRESKGKSESGKIDKKILSDIEISLKDLQISLGELKSITYDDCTSVPLLEDTIAAGNPVPISGQSSESRFFIQSWLRKFHQPLLITVGKGQRSMFPTIQPGDLLLIDRRRIFEPIPEDIYAINADEGGTVKRCVLVSDKLKLIPDNPDYSEHIIDVSEVDISKIIVGRVVWIGRELA